MIVKHRLAYLTILMVHLSAVPVFAHDWSGPYVGATLGVAGNAIDTSASSAPTAGSYLITTDFAQINAAGNKDPFDVNITGGLLGGYNKQFDRLVLGVEAGAAAINLDESHSQSAIYLTQPTASFTLRQSVKANFQETLRFRLGYTHDRFLPYVTAGGSVMRTKFSTSFSDNYISGAAGSDIAKKTLFGWSAGFGSEYALSDRLSLRAEYLFTDYQTIDSSYTITNPGFSGQSNVINNKADIASHALSFGVVYRF